MTDRGVDGSAARLAGRFPPGFRLGAATSAYQIEGAVRDGGRGRSIWDTFSHSPGATAAGETGDVAADHYHRLTEDLDLAAWLGLRAYRFSVAWPRIQPEGSGPANVAGLDFYDRLVDGLLARGIEPWLTLYHWDLPQALEDRGGWPWRGVVDAFGGYASLLARRLGDRVTRWITLNEPQIVASHGYGQGVHAPGRRDWADALRAAHHLHLAHRAADGAIRADVADPAIGIAFNLAPARPARNRPEDLAAATRRDGALARWYLDPAFGRGYPADLVEHYGKLLSGVDVLELAGEARRLDFVGVNYYAPENVAAGVPDDGDPIGAVHVPAELPVTGLGWPVDPRGLGEVLERVAREYEPAEIVVTENGAAYQDQVGADGSVHDSGRLNYLVRHLAAVADGLASGLPLGGYFAWSMLDNFEWQHGYGPRFGIVRVDYRTQRRTVKTSGRWYRDLLRLVPR